MRSPGVWAVLTLALLHSGGERAYADAVFFGPRPEIVGPSFLFENLSDYPDRDFYLKYYRQEGPSKFVTTFLTRVADLERTAVIGVRAKPPRGTIVLVAVPHGEAPPPLPGDQGHVAMELADRWLTEKAPGTLQGPPLEWDANRTAKYRVRIDGDVLDATAQGFGPTVWEELLGAICFWSVPVCGAALSLVVVCVVLLVILLRRRGRRSANT